MRIIRHISTPSIKGCVATIGNFDGLHQGHRRVLQQVKAKAAELNLPTTVISFEPLPFEFFQKPLQTTRVYPFRDKVRLLAALGVEQFVCLRFDEQLAAMEADDFVQRILLEGLQVRHLVVGDDFRFGRGRKGNFERLKTLGQQAGMTVVDTPTFECGEHQRISSSRLRECLKRADLAAANQLLSEPYGLSGRVRHGDKLGRTLQFPTLNLRMPDNLALQKGVYAVNVYGLSKDKAMQGVANLGTRPSVNGTEMRLEVHLFDFQSEVYGEYVQVEPVSFIREEQRFDSLDALKQQIGRDVEQAKSLFS